MPDTCPAASRRQEDVQVRVVWLWVCKTVESKALGQHETNSNTRTHRDGGWHLAYHVAGDSRSGSTWLVRCRRRRRHLVLNLACHPNHFRIHSRQWNDVAHAYCGATHRCDLRGWHRRLEQGSAGTDEDKLA